MNQDYQNNDIGTPRHYDNEEEEEVFGGFSNVHQDVLPDIPSVSYPARRGPFVPPRTNSPEGMDCCAGETPEWGLAPSCVPTPGGEAGDYGRQILRSATAGISQKEVPWELPFVPLSQGSAEIRDQGRELHLQHGLDGGVERDLAPSKRPCKRRKAERGDIPNRDKGALRSFEEALRDIDAKHETWVQQFGDVLFPGIFNPPINKNYF